MLEAKKRHNFDAEVSKPPPQAQPPANHNTAFAHKE